MQIQDELTAFEFDAAVAITRRNHEIQLDKDRTDLLVSKIGAMFAGQPITEGAPGKEPEEW